LLQTIWQTIFSYRIDSREKRRYRTISQPNRPIFKTRISTESDASPKRADPDSRWSGRIYTRPPPDRSCEPRYPAHRVTIHHVYNNFLAPTLELKVPGLLVSLPQSVGGAKTSRWHASGTLRMQRASNLRTSPRNPKFARGDFVESQKVANKLSLAWGWMLTPPLGGDKPNSMS